MGTKPYVIMPCTCGRGNRDLKDLAVVREQFGKSPSGKDSTYSLVVCLRGDCIGQYRTGDLYVSKLPKLWWRDYLNEKRIIADIDPLHDKEGK
jgi:hypothetical protein